MIALMVEVPVDPPLRDCGNLDWHEPHDHTGADGELLVCPGSCPGCSR